MSITLRIEEIANGWLIHTSEQENAYIGSPSPIGPKFHPDEDAVRRALPDAFDRALAEKRKQEDMWRGGSDMKKPTADIDPGIYAASPRPTIYGEDSTTAPSKREPTSESGPELHTSGFRIGDGYLRQRPDGRAEFVEDGS